MQASAKGKDHLGHGRQTSEDVFQIDEELSLYLVCDGSRDKDGRWAAETICETVRKEMKKHAPELSAYRIAPSKAQRNLIEGYFQHSVQSACAKIHRASIIDKTRSLTSSALGAVLFIGDYAVSIHVGNTRLYLMRAGKPLRLTRDHTYYEEMLRQMPKGGQVNPAFKKRLTRAIGDTESVPLSMTSVPLIPGDLLVLCSNGVSDHFSPEGGELAALCALGTSDQLPGRLIDWALQQRSDDNITALSIQISESPGEGSTKARLERPIQKDSHRQFELLRGLKVFSGIRDDEQALFKIQGLLTFRHAEAGDVIVQQGGPSDEMFMIIRGQTEVKVGGKVVAQRGPGDVLGEMGFFDGRLRSATIVATQPTEMASIQRWEFDALVEQNWRLGYKILEAVVAALAAKLEESQGAQG